MKIEPPTETDIVPYVVMAWRSKGRYDILQFNDEEYEFKQILVIFSLRTYQRQGHYKCGKQNTKTLPLDTFLICGDMVNVPSIGVQRLIPYCQYKLKKGMTKLIQSCSCN